MKTSFKLSIFYILIPVFFIGFVVFLPRYLKKQALIKTYTTIFYAKNGSREAYDLLGDEYKRLVSYENYSTRVKDWRIPTSSSFIIKNVSFNGDIGTITSDENYCFDEKCSSSGSKVVHQRVSYGFLDGRWVPISSTYCNRSTPYDMPEEFQRAVSIVIQRFSESPLSDNKEFAKSFQSIRNCLNIQYAKSKDDLAGAEGVFTFSENDSDIDDLKILVSPDYKENDDILTAFLLVHEMYHALLNASKSDTFIPCFENETNAHVMTYTFYFLLNSEEKKSFDSRVVAGLSSNVLNINQLFVNILHTKGTDLRNQFFNYVKNNPYYQKQCGQD